MPTAPDLEHLGAFAALLGGDTHIDRRGHRRTVPMEILSLGMPRTGTLSLSEAFAVLGYPAPYHYSSMIANTPDADIWVDLFRKKSRGGRITRADLDQVVGHCGAVTDTPCAILWEDLLAAYPEAKVVLVERDEDRWVKSITPLLEGGLHPLAKYVFIYSDPYWFGRIFNLGLHWIEAAFHTVELAEAKRRIRDVYREHNEGIRAAVPKQRLLVYELGSGWGPLCEFLGKDVPDVPFPHRNEARVFQDAMGAAFARGMRRSVLNVSCAMAAVALVMGCAIKAFR